jgi:hypothetical protein
MLLHTMPLRAPASDGNGGGDCDVSSGLFVVLLLVFPLPSLRKVVLVAVVPSLGFQSQISFGTAPESRAVVLERCGYIVHGFEVLNRERGRAGRPVSVVLIVGEATRDLECVADLSAVPPPRRASPLATTPVEEASGKVKELIFIDVKRVPVLSLGQLVVDLAHTADVELPDVQSLLEDQFWIEYLVMDTRNEGFIEHARSVGGEEEDAIVVVKDTQKH